MILSRETFIWVIVAIGFLMIPHSIRFPLLIIPLLIFCVIWRLLIFKQKLNHPPFWLRLILVLLGFAAVFSLPFAFVSVESMVAILLVGILLKVIEMQSHRDIYVVLFLSHFIIAAQLLFDQTLISAFYMVIGILLLTSSLWVFTLKKKPALWFYPLQFAAKVIALSVPLMIIGFLLFPRLSPFWAVPSPKGNATTGISESMSPGSISNLVKSDAVAFRAKFEKAMPALSDLYWRGPVLSDFDGVTWRIDQGQRVEPFLVDENLDDAILNYELIVEPSNQSWLFPLSVVVGENNNLLYYSNNTVMSTKTLYQKQAFQFQSQPRNTDLFLVGNKAKYLQLPEGYNPKARNFALQLWQETLNATDFIDALARFYQQEPFIYTLSPPLYSGDSIDTFLFEGKQGFCEHYASSYVFLARSVGLPARVVTGYQGGELNLFEGYFTIRQRDAHAWAEVYLPSSGWVRIDPTGFVAPERILEGSQQALAEQSAFVPDQALSHRKLIQFGWYRYLDQRYDQLNYLWSVTVLSFNTDRQWQLFDRFYKRLSLFEFFRLILGLFLLFLLATFIYRLYQNRKKHLTAEEKIYQQFIAKMHKKGIKKPTHMGPIDFLREIQLHHPEYYADAEKFISVYVRLRYRKNIKETKGYHRLMKFYLKRT